MAEAADRSPGQAFRPDRGRARRFSRHPRRRVRRVSRTIGCGKTTTLRMIAGFVTRPAGAAPPRSGHHRAAAPARISAWYSRLCAVSAPDGRGECRIRTGDARVAKDEIQARSPRFWTGPVTGLADRLPRELSGGQQQRVALARALALASRRAPVGSAPVEPGRQTAEAVRGEIRQLQGRSALRLCWSHTIRRKR